jgi:putative FmdB family regulatory protein
MPIYEYTCQRCGKRSSALLQSFSAPDPACPHCGSAEVRRLVSTFATVRSEDAGDDFEDMGGGDMDADGMDGIDEMRGMGGMEDGDDW